MLFVPLQYGGEDNESSDDEGMLCELNRTLLLVAYCVFVEKILLFPLYQIHMHLQFRSTVEMLKLVY